MKIVIKNGRLQAIAPDDLGLLNEIGTCTIHRASHVEPTTTVTGIQWTADLSPVGGPLLGPFISRSLALAAERDWLEQRLGDLEIRKEKYETEDIGVCRFHGDGGRGI